MGEPLTDERLDEIRCWQAPRMEAIHRGGVINAKDATEDIAALLAEVSRLKAEVKRQQEGWSGAFEVALKWQEEGERLRAFLMLLRRIVYHDTDAVRGEVKALEPGRTPEDCFAIDLANAMENSMAKTREVSRLRDRAGAAERERDRLKAERDRHVANRVFEFEDRGMTWFTYSGTSVLYQTREAAEAAYIHQAFTDPLVPEGTTDGQ